MSKKPVPQNSFTLRYTSSDGRAMQSDGCQKHMAMSVANMILKKHGNVTITKDGKPCGATYRPPTFIEVSHA